MKPTNSNETLQPNEDFVPVHVYAKELGVPRQTVYRWIREGKIMPSDVKLQTKTVERIYIRRTA